MTAKKHGHKGHSTKSGKAHKGHARKTAKKPCRSKRTGRFCKR